MTATIQAAFDGTVFRPPEPVTLAPHTSVRLTVESIPKAENKEGSFLKTAIGLKLVGPPDWSVNLDKYLYGADAEHAS